MPPLQRQRLLDRAPVHNRLVGRTGLRSPARGRGRPRSARRFRAFAEHVSQRTFATRRMRQVQQVWPNACQGRGFAGTLAGFHDQGRAPVGAVTADAEACFPGPPRRVIEAGPADERTARRFCVAPPDNRRPRAKRATVRGLGTSPRFSPTGHQRRRDPAETVSPSAARASAARPTPTCGRGLPEHIETPAGVGGIAARARGRLGTELRFTRRRRPRDLPRLSLRSAGRGGAGVREPVDARGRAGVE